MTDHRWLTLARTIAGWVDSLGGYVVTKNDKIIIGTGQLDAAREHWADASVYFVCSPGQSFLNAPDFEGVARLIIPDTYEMYGVGLNVEIEAIELYG